MKTRDLGPAHVTDQTPAHLIRKGWRASSTNWTLALWTDPRTGERWSISQAAAIQKDRDTPRYTFNRPRGH
jgi:hypothetical protein